MTSPRKPRLTWSREPNEKGLARVCQGERGYDLKYGGKRVAYVRPLRGLNRATVGYFCVARCDELGIDLRNTCDTPAPTIEEAKSQCIAYVRECLARKVPDAD